MNVLNPRPSAFDGMSWTATPPPYGGFGGHPYATGGMQQFDPQQQQQLPRHAYHPQSAYAPPQAPLLTNRNYQPIPHPYYSVAPYAPYAIQPSPAVNLGNGYFAQPSYSAFAPAPYAGAQPSYGYEQHAMPPPPYRAQEQMFSQYQQQQQPDETMRSQSRGRWQGRSSWEGERPASNEIWNDERREGYGWSESAQAATGVDHDHPSFDRPPHRSSAVAIQQPTPQQVVAPQQQQQQPSSNIEETQAADDVVYDLVPNVSLVPPPPPVERSAVPLADLATEMVWEAYLLAVAADGSRSPSSTSMARWGRLTSKPASLFNEVTETNRRLVSKSSKVDEVRSSPRMPELFGAIGEGRARKVPTDGSASDDSSPSSSAPGTPAGVGAIDAAAARKQRMMGFGYAIDGKSKGSAIEVRVGGLESPVEAIRTHARRLSHVNGHKPSASPPPSSPAFASEPSPAFRQFVKQVLTATLLAPEDLVLALYYVARMPSTSLVQPPALEHTNSISAKASAIKAAPFKIILGALMLANKTLQDNSYRNETFAAVSGIPLKDVNDLEAFVFGALGFDVAVRGDVWKTWVGVVSERVSSKRGDMGDHSDVESALQRLLDATSEVPASPQVAPSPVYAPATEIADVDFDESPLRCDQRGWNGRFEFQPTICEKGSRFRTSHSRDDLVAANSFHQF